jgi:hypothetical protein
MLALLTNFPFVKDIDMIGLLDSTKAVRNNDRGAAF